MNSTLKQTPLHSWHLESGANMADFGGYDMPLWYQSGVKTEHLAVLESAGIFDTSHMACVSVNGSDAFELLNFCFTRNLESLDPGRCVYGAFLDEKGYCIDDAIIYKFSDTDFMICVNAGMGGQVASHLENQKSDFIVNVMDMTAKLAKMDIQGKNAALILSHVLKSPQTVFDNMPYFSFKGHFDPSRSDSEQVLLTNGTPVLLSRSGYTGEFGFEIFLSPDKIVQLWQDLLTHGEPYKICACGLGSRDSLRAGACLPLSHQDIGNYKFMNHPWDFALPYTKDKTGFTKEFLGADALVAESDDSYVYPFVGENLRKVAAGEQTQVLDDNDNSIGHVLTCATDMGITWLDNKIVSVATPGLPENIKIRGISCGFVMVSKVLEPGEKLKLKEGKRAIKVSVVKDIRPDRTARKKISHFI